MSRVRFELVVDVDDEILAEHLEQNPGTKPPYGPPDSWNASDLADAADREIIDFGDAELRYDGVCSG